MNIISFFKKLKLSTKDQQEPYENAKFCCICKEKSENKYLKGKNIVKLDIMVIIQETNLKGSVAKKIPIVFHNESNYDYHFIIKELPEEFKKQFPCFWENTEKYIRFIVPIEKEVTRGYKNGGEIQQNISITLQLIDSAR